MRQALAVALLTLTLTGCATWPFHRGAMLLAEADRLAREGEWPAAVAAYDEFLAKHPHEWAAPRARASRDTLAATLGARAELARLRSEVARLREELARRETDLVQARSEADRLRSDLERLKQIDLKLERSR
jgi:chromosome segregation ATPase